MEYTDEELWWQHVSSPAGFARAVVETVLDQRSVVLQVPEHLPWHAAFRRFLCDRIDSGDPNRLIVMVDAADVEDIGACLLEKCCKGSLARAYRHGRHYAEFLAGLEDTTLPNRTFWFTGVTRAQLKAWLDFLSDYQRACGGRAGAICLFEMADGTPPRSKAVRTFSYDDDVTRYDVHLFHSVRARNAQLSGSPAEERPRPPPAELATSVSGGDVALGAALLRTADSLYHAPEETLARVLQDTARSDGSAFPAPAGDVARRIWTAQIKTVFPYLEAQRIAFLERHQDEAARLVAVETIYNGNHEKIEDGRDLELGTIYSYRSRFRMSERERESLERFREARNTLAHIHPLALSDIEPLYDYPLADG